MADKRARSSSSEEGDKGSSSRDKPEAKKARTKDFASGQGLEPKGKEVARTGSPEGSSTAAQQDTKEVVEMKNYLNREKLSSIHTSRLIYSLRNLAEGKGKGVKQDTLGGYSHLYPYAQKLRDFSQYPNITEQEATDAYIAIQTAYADGTYNQVLKNRCKQLQFPFAQDQL